MLSVKQKTDVTKILDSSLGIGTSMKGGERAHYCPFCHHHKKKLQVNIENQKWHCWVCDSKGRSISYLLSKLNVEYPEIQKIHKIYGDDSTYHSKDTKEIQKVQLKLPKEFVSLRDKPHSLNPYYNQAIHYLKQRGVGIDMIRKYNIGYCEGGLYGGRIIIPSYTEEGELNYFVARTFYTDNKMKYKNPPVNRNVIVFENQINWDEPITLVEGVFDSFSVRKNVIPLLGKFIPKSLMEKIKEKGVSEITIILDRDAFDESFKYTNYFINNGIKVKNIIPNDEIDAGDMGFKQTTELIKESPYTEWDTNIFSKLQTI